MLQISKRQTMDVNLYYLKHGYESHVHHMFVSHVCRPSGLTFFIYLSHRLYGVCVGQMIRRFQSFI